MNNPQFKHDISVPFIVPYNISDNALREWLKEKINLIDSKKRYVTEQMSRFHEEKTPKNRDRNFYVWIKKAKSFQSHLTEERDRLTILLGKTNKRLRENRKIKNSKSKPKLQLAQCFMMAAEEILDPDVFYKIEQKAIEIIES